MKNLTLHQFDSVSIRAKRQPRQLATKRFRWLFHSLTLSRTEDSRNESRKKYFHPSTNSTGDASRCLTEYIHHPIHHQELVNSTHAYCFSQNRLFSLRIIGPSLSLSLILIGSNDKNNERALRLYLSPARENRCRPYTRSLA